MLRDDGDFSIFCGVSPSEKHVRRFANYFERTDHELCTYSIFLKQQKDKFIGYVGVHREMEEEMTGAAHLAVKLEIDMHTGNNWYEAK